jgi:uncharacterized protein YecE (DUF72 family)
VAGAIRVGVGGWSFADWRGSFYPDGLPQKRELEHMSRALTATEINATFYGPQKPETFARWRAETPEGFLFAVKASRFATHRRELAEAAASIERFCTGGIAELKEKLGPINWQLAPTKQFDPVEIEAFLKLLPSSVDGVSLRHALEARHPSFASLELVALARDHGVAVVVDDKEGAALIPDATAPFVYARLQHADESEAHGYPSKELDRWAERAETWARGETPRDLAAIAPPDTKPPQSRDVFVFFINGFKPKAPAAAMALIERVGRPD